MTLTSIKVTLIIPTEFDFHQRFKQGNIEYHLPSISFVRQIKIQSTSRQCFTANFFSEPNDLFKYPY